MNVKKWIRAHAGQKWSDLTIPREVFTSVARNGFWMDGTPWQWIGNGARRIPPEFSGWIVDGTLHILRN